MRIRILVLALLASTGLAACSVTAPGTSGGNQSSGAQSGQSRAVPDPAPSIVDLGPTGQGGFTAIGVADNGTVAGNTIDKIYRQHGVVWNGGQLAQLSGLNGSIDVEVYSISPAGVIAGSSGNGPTGNSQGRKLAVLWKGGQITALPTPQTILNRWPFVVATAANDNGDAVGYASDGGRTILPVSWLSGKFAQLSTPNAMPVAIGADQQIVLRTLGGPHGGYNGDTLIVQNGSVRNLGQTFSGFGATTLGGDRTVVGSTNGSAVAINLESGAAYEIGRIADASHSTAKAINLYNEVTGTLEDTGGAAGGGLTDKSRAFLWDGRAATIDLTAKLGSSDWVLQDAVGINATEQIVGSGIVRGQAHEYLLSLNRLARYVAIGDSFASGEGAPPFDPRTDQPGQSDPGSANQVDHCHRSPYAWPILLTHSELVPRPFLSVTCSGATAKDMSDPRQGFTFQTEQAQWLSVTRNAKLISVMAGGDIGFQYIASGCVAAANSLQNWYLSWFGKKIGDPADCMAKWVDNALTALPGSLDKLYSEISSRKSKTTPVLVVGYPSLLPDKGWLLQGTICESLGQKRVEWLQSVEQRLNDKIRSESQKYGFTFVPTSGSFQGRELCRISGSDVNSINYIYHASTFLDQSGVFHPNEEGYRAMEKTIEGNVPKNLG